MKHRDVLSEVTPIPEPIDTVLGRKLSPRARRFVAEHADFLVRVEFMDIADHPHAYIRSTEAYHACTGTHHTIWLHRKSPDIESLVMHETMRGILMERGFPKTTRHPSAASCLPVRHLSSLLSSALIDPIIDGHLVQGGFGVYDRKVLSRRAMAQAWLDAREGPGSPYGYLFCKWTLFTVLLMLDPTFEGAAVDLLHTMIRTKFTESWELGEVLSKVIKGKGFTEPDLALTAMLELRSALRLEESIVIVDADGIRWKLGCHAHTQKGGRPYEEGCA